MNIVVTIELSIVHCGSCTYIYKQLPYNGISTALFPAPVKLQCEVLHMFYEVITMRKETIVRIAATKVNY